MPGRGALAAALLALLAGAPSARAQEAPPTATAATATALPSEARPFLEGTWRDLVYAGDVVPLEGSFGLADDASPEAVRAALSETRVEVRTAGRLVRVAREGVLFVAACEVQFLLPAEVRPGRALVRVLVRGVPSNELAIDVQDEAALRARRERGPTVVEEVLFTADRRRLVARGDSDVPCDTRLRLSLEACGPAARTVTSRTITARDLHHGAWVGPLAEPVPGGRYDLVVRFRAADQPPAVLDRFRQIWPDSWEAVLLLRERQEARREVEVEERGRSAADGPGR